MHALFSSTFLRGAFFFRNFFLLCSLTAAALPLFPPLTHANGTTFKIWGDIYHVFGWVNDLPIDTEEKNDRGTAMQRVRLWMSAAVNESLRAQGFVRIAQARWGQASFTGNRDAGFALDGDGVNLSVRSLQLIYNQPNGRLGISMGLLPLAMPVGAFHDGILRTTGGGINVRYQLTDWFMPTFFWTRPYDESISNGEGDRMHDEMDLFGLILPFNLGSTTQVTPWGMYSFIGRDSPFWQAKVPATATAAAASASGISDNGTAWWMGTTFTSSYFAPFIIKANAAYGAISTGDARNDFNTRGWQAALSLDYKLESCTPGLFGWYASGSDEDKVREDRMWGYTPTISAADHGFEPTNFGFYSPDGLSSGSAIAFSMGGTWGVGARIKGISFLDSLSHTLIAAYYGGTNDDGLAVDYRAHRPNAFDKSILTKSDRAVELNLNSEYTVNANLSFFTQLGVIDLHRGNSWDGWNSNAQTWQALTTVIYKF